MDKISKAVRSKNMAAIRAKHTKPEKIIRQILASEGFKYILYKKNLPGNPDIYLKERNALIFINGCFWHQHRNCKLATIPKSNTEFWIPKLRKNAERDNRNYRKLKKMGYNILTLWECKIYDKRNAKKVNKNFIVKRINGFIKRIS